MTVLLGERFEKMLQDLIKTGRFQNQNEVVRAGLRLLEDEEYGYTEAMEADLLSRLNSPSTPWTKSSLKEIRKLERAKLNRRNFNKAA